jgi:hypothetical protein
MQIDAVGRNKKGFIVAAFRAAHGQPYGCQDHIVLPVRQDALNIEG